ncbi:MAG: hypothetical protein AAAC47_00670 [Pararhizobium sp.]
MPKGANQGLFYAPSPQPEATLEGTQVWCLREFERIANVLREGGSQALRLDVLQALPEKPIKGMCCYFAAGIAGAGEGLYEYRGSAWFKL